MAIKVGDAAPDFTLQSQAGEPVTLSDFQGQKVVVLYFYPKDDTPGCTTESCTFRDSFQDFQDLCVEVIG
ncbi:MAG: redoxin domain-containing protein, partial [Cyanobacteria bacterium J06628_4]